MSKEFQTRKAIIDMAQLVQHPTLGTIYDYSSVADLVDSIAETGMIEAIKVKEQEGRYLVLSGWRRLLAAQQLGWNRVSIEVILDLADEDEDSFILASNKKRSRTLLEKHREIKKLLEVRERGQGQRTDLTGEDAINTRQWIAKELNMKEWEVRDILTVAGFDEQQLATVGTEKGPSLSGLAKLIRRQDNKPMPKSPPVVHYDLSVHSCPLCNTMDTPRIEVINRTLFYINDFNNPLKNQ